MNKDELAKAVRQFGQTAFVLGAATAGRWPTAGLRREAHIKARYRLYTLLGLKEDDADYSPPKEG